MKILVLVARDSTNPHAAGGDSHITLLARELGRQGHEVELWCCREPSQARAELDDGVRIVRLAPLRLLTFAVWGSHFAGRTRRFDLVVEDLIGGARIPFFSAALSRKPHIGFWFQNNEPLFAATFSSPIRRLARFTQTLLLAVYRNRFVIVPSRQTGIWLESCGYNPARIAVYPRLQQLPAPVGGFRSFEDRQNEFVCVGNIRPHKRLDEAIEVLAQLRQSVPGARLTIIGREDDDSYLQRLVQRAAEPDVAGHVEILVDAPEEAKFSRLSRSRVLTLHSPVEGLGWTIIEAGACGTPSVGNTGIPEDVLVDGVNGIRVPFRSVGSYVEAIRLLMTNADVWQRMSRGAQDVAARFTHPQPNKAVHDLVAACFSRSTASTRT